MTLLNENMILQKAQIEAIEEKQIFFVGGMAKSGTTWLERIIDAHPEAVCKGESHFGALLEPAIRQSIATYNALIPKRGNWSRHRNENSSAYQPDQFTFDSSDFDCLLAEAIKLMFAKWAESKEIRCIGDKSPHNLMDYPLLQRVFPQAKYIHMMRDVRDVVVSGWFFNLALDPARTVEQYQNIHQYAVNTAKLWYEVVSRSRAHGRILKERYYEVQYEKLWHEPGREAANLFDYLDVSSAMNIVEDCLRQTDFSILSKGRTRGHENRSSFFRKGVIGDWENHLDTKTLDEIDVICGTLLGELGYD